jgi:hypothetical protein
MDLDDVIISHPHDYFRIQHLGIVPGTCFVLMPFAPKFRMVFETINDALGGLMKCTRADDLKLAQPILERILRGISQAELIIADVTDRNANVFYELGLAHTRTKNVLLLTQNINDVPFDLRGFFCHQYELHSKQDLDSLAKVVRRAAEEVRARTLPLLLEGPSVRTERIVLYMEQLLKSPKGIKGLIIRLQARVTSIANTGRANLSEPNRMDYSRLLEREGELLIELIERGASLQAIIWPHMFSGNSTETNEERIARLDKLIDFIENRIDCMTRSQFVLSPTFGANLLFFGEEVLFEGHKTDVERGFGWTQVFTDENYVKARIGVFDRLFESARINTINKYGDQGNTDQEALRTAVLKSLIETRGQPEH